MLNVDCKVYEIPCRYSFQKYYGETVRDLKIRIQEPKRDTNAKRKSFCIFKLINSVFIGNL